MNGFILDKANLKNNPRQYIHTCCFGTKIRAFVLKIPVLQKKTEKSFLGILEKSVSTNSFLAVKFHTFPFPLLFKEFYHRFYCQNHGADTFRDP